MLQHLEQFDSTLSLDENIEKLFFSRTAFFSEEQIKTVVTGEKLNPVAYNSIIDANAQDELYTPIIAWGNAAPHSGGNSNGGKK